MAMSESNEYVIDGNTINKLLEPYNLEAVQPTTQLHHLLPGQVFDLIEKKFLKTLTDEIDKSKAQTVKFVNLEAIATGPHKDYLHLPPAAARHRCRATRRRAGHSARRRSEPSSPCSTIPRTGRVDRRS